MDGLKVLLAVRDDVIFVLRRQIYAETHQHHALQLTLALENYFQVTVDHHTEKHQVFLIERDYPHVVIGQAEWVVTFLINPETALAKNLQHQVLQGTSYRAIQRERVSTAIECISALLQRPLTCQMANEAIDLTFAGILGKATYKMGAIDTRISEALTSIHKDRERKIGAKALAEEVFLSEGRFGHLFKEEVGIPLRRYLLWQRLRIALESIIEGKSFTFAAHNAGFTDSAHLSRTFRQMYGISLSEMFAHREQINVVFCSPPIWRENENVPQPQ
jgi:AraC-like DNA-binding protein